MAKENPNVEAPVAGQDAAAEAPKTIPVEQYDALVKQVQDIVAEANRRISALEAENKLLKDTLSAQNKLILANNSTPEAK